MTLALDNVRGLMEWGRRQRPANGASAESLVENVGIVGAGMMGRAIAAAHVECLLPVVLTDANQATMTQAVAAITAESSAAVASQGQSISTLIRPAVDLAEAARCDLVLECIVELLPAKQRFFAQLQPSLPARAIVASNTSTIAIGRLAEGFADASRFCGMHFLHPVRQRPVVEIVRGPRSSDRTIAAAVAHVRRIGRIPIVVADGPGFLVNRLLFPYLGAALELLQEGASIEAIEQAAAQFGMAIGPLRLMDEIGLDTTLQAAWVLAAAFPERIVSSPLLVSMVKAGRLGRKARAGFYAYEPSPEPVAVGPAEAVVKEMAARWFDLRSAPARESISLRLVLPMLLEATRVLEEEKIRDAREVDLASLFGLGFPHDKGGLLWWADSLGAQRILDMLRSDGAAAGRNRPTAMLSTLAKTGGRFHGKAIAAAFPAFQSQAAPAAEVVPW
jgi:3-hydroxyacyl-CoA dehydrogenase